MRSALPGATGRTGALVLSQTQAQAPAQTHGPRANRAATPGTCSLVEPGTGHIGFMSKP